MTADYMLDEWLMREPGLCAALRNSAAEFSLAAHSVVLLRVVRANTLVKLKSTYEN
jgi:hypothetical protein